MAINTNKPQNLTDAVVGLLFKKMAVQNSVYWP